MNGFLHSPFSIHHSPFAIPQTKNPPRIRERVDQGAWKIPGCSYRHRVVVTFSASIWIIICIAGKYKTFVGGCQLLFRKPDIDEMVAEPVLLSVGTEAGAPVPMRTMEGSPM